MTTLTTTWAAAALIAAGVLRSQAMDQPQWGEAWTRNMISAERNLPERFDRATGENVKWVTRLGTESHATPVVAGGRIYIGTNNGEPRDPKHKGDRGVLMCLDEKTGALLWQLVVPKRVEDIYVDWPNSGICSPATVEGERVYIVSNRGEVLCLDVRGMANGNDGPFKDEGRHMTLKDAKGAIPEGEPVLSPGPLEGDILWLFDLPSQAGIYSHDAAHSTIMVEGDYLYLNTGTGVDNTHRKIRIDESPSLVVLDKHTGGLIARDNEKIAPNIFHSTWAGPTIAEIRGKRLVFFAAGNGVVYAFEPLPKGLKAVAPGQAPMALKKVWQFDFDPAAPKTEVHKYNSNRRESPSNFFGMPIPVGERVYVAGGGDIWWGKNQAWLKCIDATLEGDITEKGLVWTYPLERHVLATPAVHGGLVFIGDVGRKFHCVDAATGKGLWTHDIRGDTWASAYVADGKVYLGTRAGWLYVFEASRDKRVLAELDLKSPISATVTAANQTLYVTTMTHLYALATGAKPVARP